MNLNKKNKELLMYCVLAFAAGYLLCMYYPVHSNDNGYSFSVLEGQTNSNNANNRANHANHGPNSSHSQEGHNSP